MFEKLLSSFGVGSAKVNTVLLEERIERGKEMKGEVHIFGGKTDQKISKIYIHIDSEFHKDEDDTTEFRDITEPILEIEITDELTVKANEEKVVPFTVYLPYYLPVTFGDQKVTIQTEVDISLLNHPIDHHDVTVTDQTIENVLSYIEGLGFSHTAKSGLCRHRRTAETNPTHCLQTFQLVNQDGVKVHFVGNEEDLHIYVYDKGLVHHCPVYRNKELGEQVEKLRELLEK
ncbi:sporulation protein [Halalkalibacter oceani]|uniref:sporulation protein n=1 Tax=Halalkalibacter oceani TaxID=1653776 RepID=UPI00339292CA